MTAVAAEPISVQVGDLSEREYKRRVRAWTLYDWANSAFATTILAAVLPVYYTQVAGATLPSENAALTFWSFGLSISLFIVAIISPILGTISDIRRSKKPLLAIFAGVGILATGLLYFADTGDWLLASVLFILGRVGFTGSVVFYDALLPHVAKPEDQDRVSTQGYAMGYLGGGILLAVNIVMIQLISGTLGARLSLLSVAIWWGVFTIPLFMRIPEPPADTTDELQPDKGIIVDSFTRLRSTLRDIRHYRELFRYLIAFLLYNDGIGTIIGLASAFGASLGLGTTDLILALLLVQFVGIPFSMFFGRLPVKKEADKVRRDVLLAFVAFNAIVLPIGGIAGRSFLPTDITGAVPTAFGAEGVYAVADYTEGDWQTVSVPADDLLPAGFAGTLVRAFGGKQTDASYAITSEEGAMVAFPFTGQTVEVTYSAGPEGGIWEVHTEDGPVIGPDGDNALRISTYSETVRYGAREEIDLGEAGDHTLMLINTGESSPGSTGTQTGISSIEVLPPVRQSNLLLILGLILAVQVVGLAFAFAAAPLFKGLAAQMTTKSSIVVSLAMYVAIVIAAFFLDSSLEFWTLAWMVAIVQGGSQALSRSLYAALSPSTKSGEFFGLFAIMEKFSAILGPLIFGATAAIFGNSRIAILSLIAFFVIGVYLLMGVDVQSGCDRADAEDEACFVREGYKAMPTRPE